MRILYKASLVTESLAFLKSKHLMLHVSVFSFCIKYLMNAEYVISS